MMVDVDTNTGRAAGLKAIFIALVQHSSHFDSTAAGLIDAYLQYSRWATRQMDGAYAAEVHEATAALELLSHVPMSTIIERQYMGLSEYPICRRALWKRIMIGLVHADDAFWQPYMRALTCVGYLTSAEKEQLKACIDVDLNMIAKDRPHVRRRIAQTLRSYPSDGSEQVFTLLLKILSQWSSVGEKMELVSSAAA